LKKFAWKPPDANDREEGNKCIISLKMQEKKCKAFAGQPTDMSEMIEQAKAAIERKNAAMAELKPSFYFVLSIAEKLLKDELSNKEAQTKLVEKMLGDVKLNYGKYKSSNSYAKAILEIAESKGVLKVSDDMNLSLQL
jgi:molybdopterin-biosynthesis enzyme MoeA-like protein